MAVAQSIHPQARDKIQIAAPFVVEGEDAFPALDGKRIAVIGGKQKALLALGNLVKGIHKVGGF